jgi:DNA-cytosine methyltransferase
MDMTGVLEEPTLLRARGTDVALTSASALARWPTIYLLEDNAARAGRRQVEGLAASPGHREVVVRVHAITRSGIETVAEDRYKAGELAHRAGKAAIALALIDAIKPARQAAVVAGPAYGDMRALLEGLVQRELCAAVEIRPSALVSLTNGCGPQPPVCVSDLLTSATWSRHEVSFAGGAVLDYAVAKLGTGEVRTTKGLLFAGQTGAIQGLHRGTLLGLSTDEAASPCELIQAVGWVRWIRPLVRRGERRYSARSSAQRRQDDTPLRANITLSRLQDESRSDALAPAASAKHLLRSTTRPLNVVELFAGGGGMGLGFLMPNGGSPGYRLILSAEVHPVFVHTLATNHQRLRRIYGDEQVSPSCVQPLDLRLRSVRRHVIDQVRDAGGTDVLIGGPPCQGFSSANRNSWHSANPHNSLVDVFLAYVRALRPKAFLLENVQGLYWTAKHGGRESESVLDHIHRRASAAGYQVFIKLLDAVWYGVPQFRSRVFVLGLHRDLGYTQDDFGPWGPFPRPTHGPGTSLPYVNVREAIADLPVIGNGQANAKLSYAPRASHKGAYRRLMRRHAEQKIVTDHVTSRHADYVLERYKQIPPGGNWEDIAHQLTNYADVGRTHSNIYRRLRWDEPAITIGHYRKSMLVHPSQHRGLSLREACRLQSFPDWFEFAGSANGDSGGLVHKQQQLANAVSPLLTRAIANYLLRL